MKRLQKALSLLLALVMVMSLVACGNSGDTGDTKKPDDSQTQNDPGANPDGPKEMVSPIPEGDYDTVSAAIYEAQLGEFKEYYDKARTEAKTVSERFALMAIAEAKMLESAVILCGTTHGGNFGITRIAYRSGSTVLWGLDRDRQHDFIVTKDLITVEQNDHLKQMWNELRGTGTYHDEAIKYLESEGHQIMDTVTLGYGSDPKTWDMLSTSKQPDSQAIMPGLDNLIEYDCENMPQPALAESWEISEDGLTYTFKIREGVKWVDNQGRVVADMKADDFVAGMQHVLDAQGGLEFLVDNKIVNAHEYINGEITDFAEVGVKALDDHTLQYTLTEPVTYFMTMLNYSVFSPMSRDYFLSKGGAFGIEAFQDASNSDKYTYGKNPESIAYCGPYLCTSYTPENSVVYEANPEWWNKDNLQLKKIQWTYNDGKDPTKAYKDAVAGTIASAGLTSAAVESCKKDGRFDKYARVSGTEATTFTMFFNMNRQAYANFNDATKAVSTMTEDQKMAEHIALNNVHFRRAVAMGIDMGAYNAQVVGEELKYISVRNSYTPGDFVTLEEETTVSINGTDKTYPAGTYYGQIVQDQIDADGVKIKVWDPETQSSDGFSGWYNPEAAMEELKIAIEEVKEYGLEISPENPVHLDLPFPVSNEAYTNRANALKQSVETSLQGNVVINLVSCADFPEWSDCGFSCETGAQANYSLYDNSGWGPDYGDPSSYLDTMLDEYAGYVTKNMGIY